jgi:Icc-related predicted phosphoesterase
MKILCISDQIDPLVYSSRIKERFADVDFVLCAGDLPLDYLEFIVSSLDRPVYFVFGNHDLKHFAYYTHPPPGYSVGSHNDSQDTPPGAGTTHIGSRLVKEGGLLIAGLGGSMQYNHGENQYSDFQMRFKMVKLIPRLFFNKLRHGRFLDILLTHAAPLGYGDHDDPCHRGYKSFLWFMRTFRPRYLIHGHIHLYDISDIRVRQFEDTAIINVFSHYILDIKTG